VQIVDYFIDGLQSDRRTVALTEIGVIITAHAGKLRNFRLDCAPVFGGSPAGGNKDNDRKARQFAIAVYSDAPLPNADHPLFCESWQCFGQKKGNDRYSRSVETHIE
jgi:hypothetical protein